MALLSINDSDIPSAQALRRALDQTCPTGPIVILIHGYRFDPNLPDHDPHTHILSLTPDRTCWKAVSWPRKLGLAGDAGLAIGWGWHGRGSIWRAHRQARASGRRLAGVLEHLRALAPDRPIHILAHSLGARVALCALDHVPARTVNRLILISAAVFRSEAARLLATPAGKTAEVFNIRGRENTLFDLLLRLAKPFGGCTLGRGLPRMGPGLDLPLDRPDTLTHLRRLGYAIAAPKVRVCHWSGYLRPGVWRFYRALLLTPGQTPLPYLQQALDPVQDTAAPPRRFWPTFGLRTLPPA